MREVSLMLKAIHAQENKEAAREKAASVVAKLREMKLSAAYSEETAQPFQRNGMLFRFKRHKAC
jgi:hypothetical protein